ncbi:hypothetical protein CEE39_08095 [bacterium (candidate division B38) B3_B38]|nr:MAG: hypothetical protein CEE39_08095 [bacterium (candidate division B38) B3_B38]
MFELAQVRRQFPELSAVTYLNNAAQSLIPIQSRQALLDSLSHRSMVCEERIRLRQLTELKTRKNIARLLNGSWEEIVMVTNTSEGLNIIAQGASLKEGDNIVVPDNEFPANLLPWLHLKESKGVEMRLVPSRGGFVFLDDIKKYVNARTRLLALSHVGWVDGFRHTLQEIGEFCQRRGIIFVVDAIQSVGALNIDVKECKVSALTAGGYKWLLSPCGTGFLYIDQELLSSIKPTYLSYLSISTEPEDFQFQIDLRPDASRFKLGSINDMGIGAMEKSLELILYLGMEQIESYLLSLTDLLAEGLQKKGHRIVSHLDPAHRSSILTFEAKGDAVEIYNRLQDHQVIVSLRRGWLRVSPHFYNSEEDIARLLEHL